MKKGKLTVIVTLAVSALVGVAIVAWSVHQRQITDPKMESIKSITDENFEREVVEASKVMPVLVDFYADWCFPCKMLDPILKEVADDLKGKAVIGKINTDQNLIPRRFGINKIPAIFIIRDGEIKNAFYGVVTKETIVAALTERGS